MSIEYFGIPPIDLPVIKMWIGKDGKFYALFAYIKQGKLVVYCENTIILKRKGIQKYDMLELLNDAKQILKEEK